MAVLLADIPCSGPQDTLSPAALDEAAREIRSWPEYRPSPLLSLPGLARRLGLGGLAVKDEGQRFGRGGVKALGAPYGLGTLLRARGLTPGTTAVAALTAIAATDGNHGLALAWAARRVGCQARIYVGRTADPARVRGIRACGAEVVAVPGTYDEAVLAAERAVRDDPALLLVTDTDYGDHCPVTRAIMAGYALLGEELHAQMEAPPTHLVLQCGVGGVAAGIAAGLWQASGRRPPVVTVEPDSAACVRDSLTHGQSIQVAGPLRTRMAGLSCGRPSRPALSILRAVTRHSLTVSDDTAARVQALLAAGETGDAPLLCGDTGVAGLAGLWVAATDPALRAALGLGPASRVVAVVSEGPPAPSEAPEGPAPHPG